MKTITVIAFLMLACGTGIAQEACNTCWMEADCYWCHLSNYQGIHGICYDCTMGGGFLAARNHLPSNLSPGMQVVARKQFGGKGLNNHGIEVGLLNSAFEFLGGRGPKRNMPGHSTAAYTSWVKDHAPCFDMAGVNERLAKILDGTNN